MEINDIIIQLESIDYISVVKMLSPVIVYCADKLIDGYKLYRDFKPKNINRIALPPELTPKYSNIDFEKLASQCFKGEVIEFSKIVIDKFSSEDLINFYNNINELRIDPKKFKRSKTVAIYFVKKNLIQIDIDDHTFSIDHELFHMASSVYKNGIVYSGFSQGSLGNGLNEGYTHLLTERYFGAKRKKGSFYEIGMHFASELEKIVGQEKMESLYLNANLLGLIRELENYASEEEIMKFISGVDFLEKYYYDKKALPFKKEMIESSLKNINMFLFKVYIAKVKKQLEEGTLDMDKNKLLEEVKNYMLPLGYNYDFRKNSYDHFDIENLQESLRIVLGDLNLNMNEITIANESTPKAK